MLLAPTLLSSLLHCCSVQSLYVFFYGAPADITQGFNPVYFERVIVLFTPGADVNRQTTMNDHTVLSLACAGGHLAVVELLLAHGADPLHKLKVRTLALKRECCNRHVPVYSFLFLKQSLVSCFHRHCLVTLKFAF